MLVTVLTVVMIVGFLVLIGFLVTRFPGLSADVPLPDRIELPGGAMAVTFTQGSDWFAVVTDADQILIYNSDGSLRQTVQIKAAE